MGRKDLEESDRRRWRKTSSEKEERGGHSGIAGAEGEAPPRRGRGAMHRLLGVESVAVRAGRLALRTRRA